MSSSCRGSSCTRLDQLEIETLCETGLLVGDSDEIRLAITPSASEDKSRNATLPLDVQLSIVIVLARIQIRDKFVMVDPDVGSALFDGNEVSRSRRLGK